MFVRMLKLPDEVRAPLRRVVAAVRRSTPPRRARSPVKQQMIEWWGPIIHEYYAGTEGNGFVYCNSEMWLAHPGTVGTPIGCTVHIVDDDGEELPPGETGTIYFEGGADVRVPQRPREDGGVAPPDRAGRTLGDVGYLDDDGFLYLTDRKAYMIISGGVNIYPQEAENVLVTHPKVVDVAVFGVPNDDFGEEVKAVVAAGRHGRRRARARARAASPTAASTSPTSSARARSTSAPSCPATRPASSTSASSRTSTGPATTAGSDVGSWLFHPLEREHACRSSSPSVSAPRS